MVTKTDIEKAYKNIEPHIVETVIRRSTRLSDMCGAAMLLKLENLQITGSFKERGALNRLMNIPESDRKRGVIAASAGNHAQGVACHARRLGIPVKIVMPRVTPLVKVTSTQYWGADVILEGENYDEAYRYSQKLTEDEGATYIHPFADPLVIAGQGTIGIEVLNGEVGHEIDAIVVPVGGGGLISGIAAYVKAVCPEIRIVGVEAENCDSMKKSLEKGSLVAIEGHSSLADGISVKNVGQINLAMVKKYVDEIVTVNDDEIANAILNLLEIEKIVVEGAGAAPVAAIMNGKVKSINGKNVLSIVSGGNIDVNLLSRIITRGLAFDGRIMQVQTRVCDVPGALSTVLEVFYRANANILEVAHDHYSGGAPIGQIIVSFTLETKSEAHIEEIERMMMEEGYDVLRTTLLTRESRNIIDG